MGISTTQPALIRGARVIRRPCWRAGAHVRVTLVLQHVGPRWRRLAEAWCAGAGAAMAGYFAWYTVLLVRDSMRFGDVSPGMVPVPLWVPQTAMALGLIVLTIALVDGFVAVVRGRDAGVGPGVGGGVGGGSGGGDGDV